MTTNNDSKASGSSTKEIVLSFIKSLNDEDFKTARNHVNNDMKFEGVLASRNGADAYFEDMKKMMLKYEVIKAFAEGNDVCLLSDVSMQGVTMFACSWYQLKDGKINLIKVVFDPRPALESSGKK